MQANILTFLIDDDTDDQEVFSLAMEEAFPSVKCVFANDGIYALEKFDADNTFIPDLIFIDINMPRMNGIQCLAEIKKLSRLNKVPAYMYSTSAEPQIVAECLELGAAGFIKKEVSVDELQKKISQILSQVNKSTF
jgi:CheY-like chemotaxis protein